MHNPASTTTTSNNEQMKRISTAITDAVVIAHASATVVTSFTTHCIQMIETHSSTQKCYDVELSPYSCVFVCAKVHILCTHCKFYAKHSNIKINFLFCCLSISARWLDSIPSGLISISFLILFCCLLPLILIVTILFISFVIFIRSLCFWSTNPICKMHTAMISLFSPSHSLLGSFSPF